MPSFRWVVTSHIKTEPLSCIFDTIVSVLSIKREHPVHVLVMLGVRLRLKYLSRPGGRNLKPMVTLGSISSIEHVMVTVESSTTLVEMVSVGFDSLWLTAVRKQIS